MKPRHVIIPAALVLAFAGAGVAEAHVPAVTPSCTGLHVTLANYVGTGNTVTTTIDGHTVTVTFASGYTHDFPWPQTVAHNWHVVVTSTDHIGELDQAGRQDACVTETSPAPSTTILATTTRPTLPPTSTSPPSSTTTLPSTTSVPVSTSVPSESSAVTTTTPTTLPPSSVPAVSSTSTSPIRVVSSAPGTSTSSRPPSAASEGLPATGADTTAFRVAAGVCIVAGLGALAATRRRRA